MRVISFYLPQYHRVKENDNWWGEGFTDWEPTKKCMSQFDGHYQPHIPLGENYYDLSHKETMIWQADLMRKYGIDGQAIYHYWFDRDTKILEKPLEQLLEWKDVKMPFCIYWANETWKRSWSTLRDGASAWMDDGEGNKKSDDGVLLLQQYGDETEWSYHFAYCLPFFQDQRYIRIDNKPVFIIYRSSNIPDLRKMTDCWRRLAVENGLEGLYIIGAYFDGDMAGSGLDATLIHEPPRSMRSLRERNRSDGIIRIDYSEISEYVLDDYSNNSKTYYTSFTGFDDTPRRGKRGIVLEGATPEKFRVFLGKMMAKNKACGNDITFINAWNEWGEGMHLEPDEKYGYSFLEAVRSAKNEYYQYLEIINEKKKTSERYIVDIDRRYRKFEVYMNYLDKWMMLRERGRCLSEWFHKNGYKKIGIYGYGIMGRHLKEELSESGVEVLFLVDLEKERLVTDVPILLPNDEFPLNDVIVISAFYFYNEILCDLNNEFNYVSLETILKEMTQTDTESLHT